MIFEKKKKRYVVNIFAKEDESKFMSQQREFY